jgi:thymidylate kinase
MEDSAHKLQHKLQHMSHPLLILVRGIPGSGKSHFASALQASINTSFKSSSAAPSDDIVVTLDPDTTDYTSQAYLDFSKERTAEGVDAKFHPYRFLRAQAHDGILSNKIIIWNQPFTDFDGFNKTIINLQAHAAQHHIELPILVVEVSIDPAIAQQRVTSRKQAGGHGPSKEVFERFIRDYVSFADKGNNTHIVNGEDDVTLTVSTTIKALLPLL